MHHRVARDASILAFGALLAVPLQVAYRVLALTALSKADYGRVALLLSIFQATLLIAHFSLPVTASRLSARTPADGRRALASALLRALAAPAFTASIGMGVVTWFVLGDTSQALVAAFGTAAMAIATVGAGYLRGVGRVWAASSILPFNGAAQLLVLGAVVIAGRASSGSVLDAYYVGNLAALCLAAVVTRELLTRSAGSRVVEPRPVELLRVSGYFTIAAAATAALTVAPRVFLASASYEQVAVLDFALLAYTLWQRVTGSVFAAVVPAAASARKSGGRMSVPSLGNALVLAAVVGVIGGVLVATSWLEDGLAAVGLGDYTAAAPAIALLSLAAPAELFLSISSGSMAGAGMARALAGICACVLAGELLLLSLVRSGGPAVYAGVVVLSYWGLYLATRPFLSRAGSQERTFSLRGLRSAVGGAAD